MYSFGATPPRQLESFGVAGLLSEEAKVYYNSLFSTRHVGRVSDLIAANLRGAGLDELRVRSLVLFSTFEVFRSQVEAAAQASDLRLPEPLVIECGVDDDKIAVGVSFIMPEGGFPTFKGLAERIGSGKATGIFEELLVELYNKSDRLVVRGQKGTRRVELVALLGIPGQMDEAALAEKAPVAIVTIADGFSGDSPKPASYIELGDLDYPELLKDSPPGVNAPAVSAGAALVLGVSEIEESVRVRGKTDSDTTVNRIGGAKAEEESVVRIKGGGAETTDQSVIRVSGGNTEVADRSEMRVVSGNDSVRVMELEIQIRELEEKLRRQQTQGQAQGVEGEGDESAATTPKEKIQDILKKVKRVWPFSRKNDDEDEDEDDDSDESDDEDNDSDDATASGEAESSDEDEEEEVVVTKKGKKKKVVVEEEEAPLEATTSAASSAAFGETDAATRAIIAEFQTEKLDQTLEKAQKEAAEIKAEMGSPRAKRWVDGLMQELVQEKARLHEASKKLNSTMRSRELEFRNREASLTEELRRRDEMIRQKTNALNRAKDQVTQVTIAAERNKSSKGSGGEDGHFKQKYGLSQKMLTSAKEENQSLQEKISELKNQLMSAQMASSKRNQPSIAEYSALQAKFEREKRQADELKKANVLLQERVSEAAKKERVAGSNEDARKQLDVANKRVALTQKEAEKLALQLEESQRESVRLQMELNKALSGKNTKKPSAA